MALSSYVQDRIGEVRIVEKGIVAQHGIAVASHRIAQHSTAQHNLARGSKHRGASKMQREEIPQLIAPSNINAVFQILTSLPKP